MFRDCQIKTLIEQANTRGTTKVKHAATSSGQGELFESLYEMTPNDLTTFLNKEQTQAKETLLGLSPKPPQSVRYDSLWPQVLLRHVVRLPDVNKIAAALRLDGSLVFLGWEKGKRVPQPHYRVQRI